MRRAGIGPRKTRRSNALLDGAGVISVAARGMNGIPGLLVPVRTWRWIIDEKNDLHVQERDGYGLLHQWCRIGPLKLVRQAGGA